MHAARLQPRHRPGDQRVPRAEHVHSRPRLQLRQEPGRDRSRARGARRRHLEIFVLPPGAPQFRPGDRIFRGAAAAVLAVRDRGFHRLGARLPGGDDQAPARRPAVPGDPVGPRHPAVLSHRHRIVRRRSGRRIRRPHLPASPSPSPLPGGSGPRAAAAGVLVAVQAVVFGYHDVGVRCLRVLLDAGVAVPLVVTHRDDPNERIWFGSVAQLAHGHGIETLVSEDMNHLRERISVISPEFIFSFYYRRMLPPEVLVLARKGAFNMHGSLLPKYRGRAPVNWAILKGETETGATLHEMTAKPDAGRIVGQERVPIGPDETAVEVFRKVTDAAESVLRLSIKNLLAGKAVLHPQDLSKGSYFGSRKPEDGRIDWSTSAQEIHNLVRAVAPPYPGAFTEGMKIFRSRIEIDKAFLKKGPYQEAGQWFAGCGDGKVLRLLEV